MKTLPGADYGSDHNPLVMKARVKVKTMKKPPHRKKFDTEKIGRDFSIELKNRFQYLELQNRDSDELWNDVKSMVLSVAEEKIPKLKKKKKSRWLSTKAIEIADERREARVNRSETEVRRLNAEFQRQARQDKESFLQEKCKKIEEDNKIGRTRDLFKEIKDLTGKFRPKAGVIKNHTGKTVTETEEIKNQWKEYTENL